MTKVKYTIDLDIDEESWDLQFSTGRDAKSIREDVKSYLDTVVIEQLHAIDALKTA
jgi:hypothetical protein